MSTDINIKKKISIEEEGALLTADVNNINFVGPGVTASTLGNDVTVTVAGSIGGTVYYMNETVTQAPYKEFSSNPTSAAEQIIPATVAGGATATIAAYQTPVGVPNTTVIPAGLWQLFLHFNAGSAGQNWIIRPYVYKRDLGGIETLIFTPDPQIVTGMSTTTTMYTCDGVFPNTTLLTTDRIVVKIDVENTSGVSQTVNFRTEGSQHYSVAATTLNQAVSAGSVTSVSGTAPIVSSGGSAPAISIPQATALVNGYLSSSDWSVFNSKVASTRSISTSAPLAGGGDLSADRTLSITQATSSVDGYLSSTDWSTFSGKQNAITLTTTGTSGAATLVGSTLNIPQYAGGLVYFTEARNTTAPNTTTNVDSLSAGNGLSTTDIDIALLPRANGAFLLDIPDSSITGGNKRGTNAIDLQISRTASTQVASGNYAVAIGYSNTASNTSATAIGQLNIANAIGSTALGYSNTSSGSYSTTSGFTNTAAGTSSIAMGASNSVSNDNSIGIGIANTASGYRSVSIGVLNSATGSTSYCFGNGNTANRTNAVAIGYSSTAAGDGAIAIGNNVNTFLQHGRISFSSGAIGTSGDIQKSFYILKGRTTDATPKTLTSDNGSITTASVIVLQNNNVFRFKGSIVGKQTGTTNIAVWDIDGVIVRGAGVATTVLTIANINLVTNAPGWGTPTLTADTTLGGLTVNVIGLAATNIQWVADIETSEVVY